MSEPPKFLLRSWGGDIAQVIALRTPDAYEPDDHVACWWFYTPEERQAFISAFNHVGSVMRDKQDPGADEDGEIIDTRARTVAVVTLKTPDGQVGTFEMNFGYGYSDHAVRFMFEDGNYACDCNRRDFLKSYCNIGEGHLDDMTCGDTIELVSLETKHIPLEELSAVGEGEPPR